MKKQITMQIVSFAVFMAFLIIPVSASAQGSKADFAGKWAFNAEKSDLGQSPQGGGRMGGFGGGDFTATQDAAVLTVESTRTGQDGQTMTTTSKYNLDGKESVNSTGRGESHSTATWSADGKSLTIVTIRKMERDGQSMEFKTTEVWTLTGTSVLSIVRTVTTPNGEMKTTMVYDKK